MFFKLKILFQTWWLIIFYQSIWGKAIAQKVWELYKNSVLFQEREKAMGKEFAAKAFSISEFKHFKRKITRNRRLLVFLILCPYSVRDPLMDTDTELKAMVTFEK